MSSYRFFSFLISICLLFTSCEKDEVIVPDNVAPPDGTVSQLVVETYINKCYISLLGRKPTEQEESAAKATLADGALSVQSRRTMLAPIMASAEYRNKMFDTETIRLLTVPYDPNEVQLWIDIYTDLLDDPAYLPFINLLQVEIDRLEELQLLPQLVAQGQIDRREMHLRLVNNFFYDQLNMGSFNLVVSMYNHFLFRDPTEAETNAGITMVDGFTAVVFYENGSSKDDFIRNFFNSDDYHEGVVRELFLRHLFREPTTEEMNYHAVRYLSTDNFEEVLKGILTMDEYVGL
jgi:hypothetical protein